MQPAAHPVRIRKYARLAIALLGAAILAVLMGEVLLDAVIIVCGAAIVCFLIDPIANVYEKRLCRGLAVLCAMASCLGVILLLAWLLLPALIDECAELARALPESVRMVQEWLSKLGDLIPGMQLREPVFSAGQLPSLAKNTFRFAGSIADLFYKLSLMAVLAYFILCDKEKILIRMELVIPLAWRRTAVRMGNAILRELRIYLRSQGLISAAVGILSAAGLALIGLQPALVLGILVGILNMIPYFGPLIGMIPAVLIALGGGWKLTAATVIVLWLVQQADSALISPRIMSSLTGVSPAIVLLAIFIGSGLGGVVGMLLAMPVVMTFRTVFRVFVQRYENV